MKLVVPEATIPTLVSGFDMINQIHKLDLGLEFVIKVDRNLYEYHEVLCGNTTRLTKCVVIHITLKQPNRINLVGWFGENLSGTPIWDFSCENTLSDKHDISVTCDACRLVQKQPYTGQYMIFDNYHDGNCTTLCVSCTRKQYSYVNIDRLKVMMHSVKDLIFSCVLPSFDYITPYYNVQFILPIVFETFRQFHYEPFKQPNTDMELVRMDSFHAVCKIVEHICGYERNDIIQKQLDEVGFDFNLNDNQLYATMFLRYLESTGVDMISSGYVKGDYVSLPQLGGLVTAAGLWFERSKNSKFVTFGESLPDTVVPASKPYVDNKVQETLQEPQSFEIDSYQLIFTKYVDSELRYTYSFRCAEDEKHIRVVSRTPLSFPDGFNVVRGFVSSVSRDTTIIYLDTSKPIEFLTDVLLD